MEHRELQEILNQQLPGRLLRVAQAGGFVTQDVVPGRITVWLDETGRVASVRVDGATQALEEAV
ncbi:hypothetical protein V8J88_00495 [Massilia sp. W12]|uniref:hypothetical protein n=1 Tax=Massilia sp. W12 TaxID=3126507 RepID=UPI0030D250B8